MTSKEKEKELLAELKRNHNTWTVRPRCTSTGYSQRRSSKTHMPRLLHCIHRAHCEKELFGEARMPDFPMLLIFDGPRNTSFPSSLRRATPEQLQKAVHASTLSAC